MIEQYILIALAGTIIGFVVGLIPGISATSILVIIYGFLIGLDLTSLLIFYACLINATQYSGSISALYLGIPGETNSLPLVSLRESILKSGSVGRVVVLTSVGSFLISLSALAIGLVFMDNLNQFTAYLKSWIMAVLGITGIVLSMIFTNNRFWVSVLLVLCGWMLARVGTNSSTMTEFMTFGNDYLRGGIPTITVLLGLFVVPCLTASQLIPKFDLIKNTADQIRFSFRDTLHHMSVIVRSGIVGFIAGLVPYVGVGTSSNLAYYIEKWISPKDHVKQAVAAESANNAASVSVLIPFMAFGIAIQTSEGIMLDIMAQNNLMLHWNDINVLMLFTMLVFSNIVAIVLAWPFAQQISNFYTRYSNYIMIAIVLLCVYTVLFMGTQVSQSWYYFLCLIVLGFIGFLIRHVDTLPLIFAFLLQDSLEPAIIRSIDILRFNLQL